MNINRLWQFEDEMDEFGIFVSGIDGRQTHRESYNTVMDFDKMKLFLGKKQLNFTVDEWQEIYKYFDSIAYLSPMNGLVACRIKRIIFRGE